MKTGKQFWSRVFSSNKIPIILQSEEAECGLVCLCMIANYYGNKATITELRRKHYVSSKGVTLKSLMTIADNLNLQSRALRIELEDLTKIQTPCILHWNLNHFVVLSNVDGKYIEIHDPNYGKVKLPYSKASKFFTGIVLELLPNTKFEKQHIVYRAKLSDMWPKIKGLPAFIIQLIILAIAIQILAIISPMMSQIIMDDSITRQDLSLLDAIIIGMGIVSIFQIIISLLQNFLGLYLGTQLSLQMKSNLLRHSLNLPLEWFERRNIGDILSRFGSLEPVQKFITEVPVTLALNIIMTIISFIMMAIYSFKLNIIVVVTVLLPLIIRLIFFPFVKRKTDEGLSLQAQANTNFIETIRGARTFKLFSKEKERAEIWLNHQISATNNNVILSKLGFWGKAGLASIISMQTIALWFLGAKQIINGDITLGMFIAFMSYATLFTNAVKGIMEDLFQWKTVGLHLERLADIIYEDFEKGIETPIDDRKVLQGNLSVKNLSFRYATHEPFILQEVNISINKGEFIAIVGSSGGGKTTFMKLLVGLLAPTDGEIMVNGIHINGFGIRNYRKQIGAVLQDDRLFQGTIIDNVSFFDDNINILKVEEALRQACVYDEILNMPMGLQTLVGDMGSTLSGGQAQRVLIARALCRGPKILFLDEGTANLDQEIERKLVANLRNLKITRISIAHREAAIEGADRIFKVENGTIEEIIKPT